VATQAYTFSRLIASSGRSTEIASGDKLLDIIVFSPQVGRGSQVGRADNGAGEAQ